MNGTAKEILDALAANGARSFNDGRSLPPAMYHSREILATEIEQIFRQEWMVIGRSNEIPDPGDYLTFEIAGEPVMAIRQNDGELRAFANACLHRCTTLLAGTGNVGRIVCPYHAWTYERDGKLIGTRYMDETPGFSVDGRQLTEIRLEVWEGFIYASLDADIDPIAGRLAGLKDVIGRYRMADYQPVIYEQEVWNCNWKSLVENYMDAYHVFKVHADTFEKYGSSAEHTTLFPGDDAATWHYVETDANSGTGIAHPDNTWLDGDYRHRIMLVYVFPTHTIQLQPDMLWYLSIQPFGVDQLKVRWAVSVPAEILATVDDRDAHVAEIRELLTAVNAEDHTILQRVHQGLKLSIAQQGPLSHLERNVYEFGRYLARRLTGPAVT